MGVGAGAGGRTQVLPDVNSPSPCRVFPGPQITHGCCFTIIMAGFLVPGIMPGPNGHSVHKRLLNEFKPKPRPLATPWFPAPPSGYLGPRHWGAWSHAVCLPLCSEARVQGETWRAGGPRALTEDMARGTNPSCCLSPRSDVCVVLPAPRGGCWAHGELSSLKESVCVGGCAWPPSNCPLVLSSLSSFNTLTQRPRQPPSHYLPSPHL